jgi:hypothetical protein
LDSGLHPVTLERSRPVAIFPLWMLTVCDQTRRGCESSHFLDASGHGIVRVWVRASGCGISTSSFRSPTSGRDLVVALNHSTIRDLWLTFEGGAMWRSSGDRTLAACVRSLLTGVSGRPAVSCLLSPTALFHWGLYKRRVAGLGSLSWPFLLRIHPSEPRQSSLTHST